MMVEGMRLGTGWHSAYGTSVGHEISMQFPVLLWISCTALDK